MGRLLFQTAGEVRYDLVDQESMCDAKTDSVHKKYRERHQFGTEICEVSQKSVRTRCVFEKMDAPILPLGHL